MTSTNGGREYFPLEYVVRAWGDGSKIRDGVLPKGVRGKGRWGKVPHKLLRNYSTPRLPGMLEAPLHK